MAPKLTDRFAVGQSGSAGDAAYTEHRRTQLADRELLGEVNNFPVRSRMQVVTPPLASDP